MDKKMMIGGIAFSIIIVVILLMVFTINQVANTNCEFEIEGSFDADLNVLNNYYQGQNPVDEVKLPLKEFKITKIKATIPCVASTQLINILRGRKTK